MNEFNTYDREKLYQQIWEKPVSVVAQQYGVSDVTIHKVCKALDIPAPPRGYWAKFRAGQEQEAEKPELPPKEGTTTKIGIRTGAERRKGDDDIGALVFLTVEEKEQLLTSADQIEMPEENIKLHKKVTELKSQIYSVKKNQYSRSSPINLAYNVSKATMPRVFRILSVLYTYIEALGGCINDDYSMVIRGEKVAIEISEGQDKIKHELTKEEAKQLLEYQDAKKYHRYASEPVIRKYDRVFNGKLRFSSREFRHIRDCGKADVETRIGEILIDLYIQSEQQRQNRLKWEEAQRKREEEERRKEERRTRYNKEVKRTNALKNLALDYEMACRIRTLAEVIEEKKLYGEKTSEWVEWARNKANWYDPTLAYADEYFGKRNHEEDSADKEPREKYFGW